LAVLPVVCPLAAGRRLKTRVLGCCGAGQSLVVWVLRAMCFLVCVVALWRFLPARLGCATRHADWSRTSWRAPYVLLLVPP